MGVAEASLPQFADMDFSMLKLTSFISHLTTPNSTPSAKRSPERQQQQLEQRYRDQIDYYSQLYQPHDNDLTLFPNLQQQEAGVVINETEHQGKNRCDSHEILPNNPVKQAGFKHKRLDQRSLWKDAMLISPSMSCWEIDQKNLEARFWLSHQPCEVQRKSYAHESRCLKPAPLTIAPKPNIDHVVGVSATAHLATDDGRIISILSEHQKPLEDSAGGEPIVAIDSVNHGNFFLRLHYTSAGRRVRIMIEVTYKVPSGGQLLTVKERIYSQPFVIQSNITTGRRSSKKLNHC